MQSVEVANGVVNLGNTCYMNAVIQSLAHAPDLCMAIDCEPHCASCPIYQRNQSLKESSKPSENSEFCMLCELELLLIELHKQKHDSGPVSPSVFVDGFIKHIAPWFKLGVQEDSHEFLRLLIDAMQKSSKKKEAETAIKTEEDDEAKQKEYSFRLFCGEVESTVTCSNCSSISSTIDPIEDIGLEVTNSSTSNYAASTYWRSGSSSPTPSSLTDIDTALKKFIATENLDSGYKCEECSKVGRSTKQSKLKSLPPILTLHIKRFRYGNDTKGLSHLPSRRGPSPGLDNVGSSGSAKIEGHVKFPQVFDIRPYVTDDLQEKSKSMLTRLFAVIVHSGKNSHSGHYISYVRNVAKNEWWKMDDGKVMLVSKDEVFNAEAYMLFYRVVDHPVSVDLKAKSTKKAEEDAKKELEASKIKIKEEITEASIESFNSTSLSGPSSQDASTAVTSISNEASSGKKRKRDSPDFKSGEEWARKMTNKPKSMLQFIRAAQDYFCERIELDPEYLQMMKDEVEAGQQRTQNPSFGISLKGDVSNYHVIDEFRHALWTLFEQILPRDQEELEDLFRPKEKKNGGARSGTQAENEAVKTDTK